MRRWGRGTGGRLRDLRQVVSSEHNQRGLRHRADGVTRAQARGTGDRHALPWLLPTTGGHHRGPERLRPRNESMPPQPPGQRAGRAYRRLRACCCDRHRVNLSSRLADAAGYSPAVVACLGWRPGVSAAYGRFQRRWRRTLLAVVGQGGGSGVLLRRVSPVPLLQEAGHPVPYRG